MQVYVYVAISNNVTSTGIEYKYCLFIKLAPLNIKSKSNSHSVIGYL